MTGGVRFALLVVSCALVSACSAATDFFASDLDDLQSALDEAHQGENWSRVTRLSRRIQAHEAFESLSEEQRAGTVILQGMGEFEAGRHDQARTLIEQAASEATGTDLAHAHLYLAQLDTQAQDWRAAAQNLHALHELDPTIYNRATVNDFAVIADGLIGEDKYKLHERLLQQVSESYDPVDPTSQIDWLIYRYIEPLVYGGQAEAALAEMERILYPDARLALRANSWFSELWDMPGFDAVSDPIAGAEASLARSRSLMTQHDLTEVDVLDHFDTLVFLGRFEAAEAFGRRTLQELKRNPFHEFSNDDTAYWLEINLAYVLYAQGKVDEGDAIFQAFLNQDGGVGFIDVGATINFAAMLSAQGRHDRALRVLSRLRLSLETSEYAQLWANSLYACAYHATGDQAQRDENLSRLEANWRVNAEAYQRALLCTEQTDAAAAFLIQRLEDNAHYYPAMQALQTRRSIFHGSPLGSAAELIDAFQALAERPDVAGAIEAHGRVAPNERIYVIYWGTM